MSDHRILVVCEDKRSHAALAREFSAYLHHLHLSASAVAHSTSAMDAWLLLHRDSFSVLVIVSEEESGKERLLMEQLSGAAKEWCPTVFVNLRPNHFNDASLHAPHCTFYLGPDTRVDQVRRAVRRFLPGAKATQKAGGGWR